MILDWLRSRLLANQQPRCPRCKALDWIPRFSITRTVPGKPWKQKPVGSRGFCNVCGCDYSVTVDGIYAHMAPAAEGPIPPEVANQRLGSLVGDEVVPSYRGV